MLPVLNLLVVTYHFPPSSAIGGRRIARFCEYLPEFGIRPAVVTIDLKSCRSTDESLPKLDQLIVRRVSPRQTSLERYHRWITRWREVESEHNHIRFGVADSERSRGIRRHVRTLLQFPDARRGWYRPARREAANLVNDFRPHAILSSGPPWTAHAVAYSIACRFKLPWIADFRDGWASDGARKSLGLPAWKDRLDLWLEERWVRYASLVVCTTNQQRECLLGGHPRLDPDRVATITNGLDTRIEFAKPIAKPGPRILLHAGNLYGQRRLGAFCRAVASLFSTGRIDSDLVKIVLMGDVDDQIDVEARESVPYLFENGLIAFQPRINWDKAKRRLEDADVLLIFQGNHPTAIPAKFYEYLQTGKPILAIVGNGALKDAVLGTGSGVVASPDDEAAIMAAVEQVLRMPAHPPEEVERICHQFEYRILTSKLAERIRKALNYEWHSRPEPAQIT